MVLRLARVEVARLLRRARFWGLLSVLAIWGVITCVNAARNPIAFVVYAGSQKVFPHEYATGLLYSQLGLFALLCMAVPFAVCDSFASDRKTRYIALLMARGAPRWGLVLSRMLAAVVVSLVAVVSVFAVVALTALLSAHQVHGQIGGISPFLPQMLDDSPTLYFLALAGVFALTCGAVVSIGVLLGALTTSWLVAVLTPPVIVLATQLLPLPEAWVPYSPGARATFVDYAAAWATPASSTIYWVVLIALLAVATVTIYHRREDL